METYHIRRDHARASLALGLGETGSSGRAFLLVAVAAELAGAALRLCFSSLEFAAVTTRYPCAKLMSHIFAMHVSINKRVHVVAETSSFADIQKLGDSLLQGMIGLQ